MKKESRKPVKVGTLRRFNRAVGKVVNGVEVSILVVCVLVRSGLRAMTGSRQFRATGAAFLCLVFAFFSSAHFL